MKDDTHHSCTQSFSQDEYARMIMTAKWYSGDLVGLKLPDICLTGEEKPRKNLTQETWPYRARCVTGAHVTACSTAVGDKAQLKN